MVPIRKLSFSKPEKASSLIRAILYVVLVYCVLESVL